MRGPVGSNPTPSAVGRNSSLRADYGLQHPTTHSPAPQQQLAQEPPGQPMATRSWTRRATFFSGKDDVLDAWQASLMRSPITGTTG